MHNPSYPGCPRNADPRNETCGCDMPTTLVLFDVPKDRLFSRPFAQVAWAIICVYGGQAEQPECWTGLHDAQVEEWLITDARMMKE